MACFLLLPLAIAAAYMFMHLKTFEQVFPGHATHNLNAPMSTHDVKTHKVCTVRDFTHPTSIQIPKHCLLQRRLTEINYQFKTQLWTQPILP